MTTRRTFLYQTAIATTALATNPLPLFSVNRKVRARRRLELTFEPYELQLRHVFTVASYSRSSTPDIQVRIDYDGFTGYGEASMPPYLSAELGTTESVMDFLGRAATLLREF
ncbi:MAG: twin-arginine translocation signal domain-containing protein, partial [Bacteroidaceae bacterium]|nr:twin-arginine translocation signal domain-containing protein [Bacteroidaceae bacterium]